MPREEISISAISVLLLIGICLPLLALDPSIPLARYRVDTWTTENELPNATVQSILQTRDGYLWLGTPGGLARFDGVRFTLFDKTALKSANADVLYLLEDRHRALWIGTKGGGVVRYQNGIFKNFTTRDGLSNNFVWCILEDNNGDLWFSTEKGVSVFRDDKFSTFSIPKLQKDFIWSIFQDSRHDFWFASDQSGLLQIKNGEQILHSQANGLPGNTVYCVTEDHQGALWIGTMTGLSKYENGKFTNFSTKEGLSIDTIYSLLVDQDEVLWIGTSGGGINRHVNGTFEVFDKDNVFSRNSVWSLYEDREGNIWTGPISYGLNRFAEDRKTNPTIPPPVLIEQVYVDGERLNSGASIQIHSGKLEIQYTALSYVFPEKVTFRYRLEGYDDKWINAGSMRSATYTKLSAGTYKFHVTAANHNGGWNPTGTTFAFQLTEPFTRTFWFYGLCAVLGLSLAAVVYYLRDRKLKRNEIALTMMVENRTAELRNEINDREKVEQKLKQYRILVETSNDIIWSIDSKGYFTFINPACKNVLGYAPEEMEGHHFSEFQDQKNAQKDIQLLKEVLSGKIVDVFETELFHKNGNILSLLCNSVAIRDEKNAIIGISGTAKDITLRKQSEEAIKRSEEKYRTLFEESKDAVFIISAEGKFLDLNQAGLDLIRCSSKEEAAQLDLESDLRWDLEDRKIYRGILEQQGYVKDYPIVLQRLDNQKLILLVTATALRDGFGKISQIRGIAKDVTAQKRTERLASCLHQVTRILAEATTLKDAARKTLEAICRGLDCEVGMFWMTSSELEDLKCFDFWLSDEVDPIEFADARKEVIRKGGDDLPFVLFSSGESKCVTDFSKLETANSLFAHKLGFCCGFAFPVEAAYSVQCVLEFYSKRILDDDHQLTVIASSLGNQISQFIQRKRVEGALRESEKRYRSFVEDDLRGIYISSPDGHLLACNPAFVRIFGFNSIQEALNYNWDFSYPNSNPRKEFVEKIRKNKRLEYHEHELRDKNGEPLYVLENAIGVFDEKGELLSIKGYILDTTDRKKLEQQLIQVQKMEAVGSLAGGVAHDFNNILMAITSYAELLLIRMHGSDPVRPYVGEIRKAAEQGANLTRQLLAFSRRQILSPKIIDLNESIVGMEDMLRRLIGEDVALEIVKGRNLGTVKADPGQVQQILMNLAVNSRDAMPAGGTLRIKTSNQEIDREFGKRYPGIVEGRFVLLTVKDSGHGMDEATMKRIFEPFFTTKEEGKGTGLGLATVFGIVKQSGGYIYVHSEIEKGTIFSILFPRVDADSPQLITQKQEHSVGKGETLLLVDDNEMVRSAAGSFLELNGYHVLYADCGSTAMDLLKENSNSINLIISDVVMPGMTGLELAEQVKRICPKLKMLFMSGYTDEQKSLQRILDSGCEFISKPATMYVLLHKIRKLLSPQVSSN